jgi:hypothetical protein
MILAKSKVIFIWDWQFYFLWVESIPSTNQKVNLFLQRSLPDFALITIFKSSFLLQLLKDYSVLLGEFVIKNSIVLISAKT